MSHFPKYSRQRESGRSDRAFVRIDGKKIKLGIYGSDESKAKYEQLKKAAETGTKEVLANPTINQLLVEFLKYAQGYYGIDSKEYSAYLVASRWLRNDAGEELAEEYGPKRLKLLRGQMVGTGQKRKTINGRIKRIKGIFQWAVSEELLEPDVHQKLAAVTNLKRGRSEAPESEPIRPVADEVVEATLAELPPVVADMVCFQRLTGCRPGELVILRPCDVDRSGEVWKYKPKRHKTEWHGHSRIISIGPKAQEILLRYLARGSKMQCFMHRSGCYSVDSYRRCIKRAAARAAVGSWSPHQLRHAAATEVRRHFGLDAAQSVLGHKSAKVTEVYAELNQAKADEVARRIG